MRESLSDRRAVTGGIVIGAGMGGLVEGIVLRQILQWHHFLSNILAPDTIGAMRANVFWDGVFHASMWLITLSGIWLLWTAARRAEAIPSAQRFLGALVLGWGLFNLAEGIISHHLLALHHVRQVPTYSFYNLAFLAFGGVILSLTGSLMMNAGRSSSRRS